MKYKISLYLAICVWIMVSLSACSNGKEAKTVAFNTIYKGDPLKVMFLDRRGSGNEYTVNDKNSIHDLMAVLNESKLSKLDKNIEDHTGGQSFLMQVYEGEDMKLTLMYDVEFIVINDVQYDMDKNTRDKLMNYYDQLIKKSS